MIEVDAAFAIVILVALFGTLFTLIWWARGAPPWDDGVGGAFADYLPKPHEDEGWAAPPPRTPPPWERDVDGRPTSTGAVASRAGPAAGDDTPDDAPTSPEGRGRDDRGEARTGRDDPDEAEAGQHDRDDARVERHGGT